MVSCSSFYESSSEDATWKRTNPGALKCVWPTMSVRLDRNFSIDLFTRGYVVESHDFGRNWITHTVAETYAVERKIDFSLRLEKLRLCNRFNVAENFSEVERPWINYRCNE